MIFVLPLPHKLLSPNARPHYMAKANVAKQTRQFACLTATSHFNELGADPPRLATPTMRVTYYGKTVKRPDPDNLIASLKPTLDGLTDAGVWADDKELTILPTKFAVDKFNPRLEIEVF